MYHVNVFSATAATQMRKLNLQIGNIQQSNVWINVEWINFVVEEVERGGGKSNKIHSNRRQRASAFISTSRYRESIKS